MSGSLDRGLKFVRTAKFLRERARNHVRKRFEVSPSAIFNVLFGLCVYRQLARGGWSQKANLIVVRFKSHLLSASGLELIRRILSERTALVSGTVWLKSRVLSRALFQLSFRA